jgi:hypothetical protein
MNKVDGDNPPPPPWLFFIPEAKKLSRNTCDNHHLHSDGKLLRQKSKFTFHAPSEAIIISKCEKEYSFNLQAVY